MTILSHRVNILLFHLSGIHLRQYCLKQKSCLELQQLQNPNNTFPHNPFIQMPKQTYNQSQTSVKSSTEQFPSLVPQKPQEKKEIVPLQKKQTKKVEEYPTLVSNPSPIHPIGTKEVWENRRDPNQDNSNKLNQTQKIQSSSKKMVDFFNPQKQTKFKGYKNQQLNQERNQNGLNNRTTKETNTLESFSKPFHQPLNKSFEWYSEGKDKRSSVSDKSEKLVVESSDSESEQEQTQTWPNFEELKNKVKKIQEFKVSLNFPTASNYRFQKAQNHLYSTHYQMTRVHKYLQNIGSIKKWVNTIRLRKLRIICINCDFNIPSRNGNDESSGTEDSDGCTDFKRIVKEYWKTTQQERAQQIVQQIRLAMLQGFDFICLEEICQPIIRIKLLEALQKLKYNGQNQYFFPKNLESHPYMRTTMILSKHPVKFGHVQFQISQHQGQQKDTFYFPLQAFCEFEVMIGKKVIKVGILCCHLRSNGQKQSDIRPHKMRKIQVRCIHDFSKRFDKFFCIGDTNIPSSQKFKKENLWIKRRFIDAFDVGKSPIGGTYLYRTKANKVKEERLDRVWMKKDMEHNTDVQIAFKEVLLQSCKNMGFSKRKMLGLNDERLIYISPSDHEILDICIQFTKYE